ncbi:MAG: hypothetical protein WCZ87_05660 [Thiohalobacteraceae bacterium]
MSPPVRILSLLILAAALASGRPAVLAVGGALLLLAAGMLHKRHADFDWRGLPRMLQRVRWLLLALLILYGWFTPGEALLPALGVWSPSQEGLHQGLLRVLALLAIVAAVYLLLASTGRGALVGGLLWYGGPLRRLGLDDRRFAVRLVLALEAVPQVQDIARAALQADAETSRMRRLGRAAGQVLQATLAHAEDRHGPIQIPDPIPVPRWQWFLPLALAATLLAALSV